MRENVSLPQVLTGNMTVSTLEQTNRLRWESCALRHVHDSIRYDIKLYSAQTILLVPHAI